MRIGVAEAEGDWDILGDSDPQYSVQGDALFLLGKGLFECLHLLFRQACGLLRSFHR